MKINVLVSVALIALLLPACASTNSRIRQQQAAFDAYPPAVQEKIRAGEVAIGFNAAQVRLALGEPDRIYSRETASGAAEVWAYRESQSAFSFGLGGFTGGGSGVGAGVGIGTSTDAGVEKLRVTFTGGLVSAVEQSAAPGR